MPDIHYMRNECENNVRLVTWFVYKLLCVNTEKVIGIAVLYGKNIIYAFKKLKQGFNEDNWVIY